METKDQLEILSIDDSEGDQELISIFFSERSDRYHLHLARSGKEGLEFLFHEGRYADSPTPDLVLLDLNMPGLNGHAVLDRLKANPKLKEIPVVVFSTSDRDEDVISCYESQASSYFAKPLDLDEFEQVLRKIESRWLNGARLSHAAPVRHVS